MSLLTALAALSPLLAGPVPVRAPGAIPDPGSSASVGADTVPIREWEVPWERTRPRDPHVRSDDLVWFVGQRGNYLATLTPSSGEFTRYDLPEGTGPHSLRVAPDGTVWFAGNRDAYIGHLDPETGDVERVPMPDPRARDPHTLAFDRNGDLWFTVQGGNMVGKLDVGTLEVHLVEVPAGGARPYGIQTDGKGRPWIALLGTNELATVDPATMELREVELPRSEARPRRLRLTSDGAVWYVDYATGRLGRYDPATGEFEEWVTPGGADSRPYGMAVDDRDRLWFVETAPRPNRMVSFDPATESFTTITPIPSGAGTVRNMYFYAPEGEIWFGTDANTIGRVAVP